MIQAKFRYFQIAHEGPGPDPVVFQQASFQAAPEPFDAVDRNCAPDIFVLAVVHALMRFKCLIQLVIGLPGVAVNRGIQGHFAFDNLLRSLLGHIVDRLHIHNPVCPFINAKDGLLQVFRSPATLHLPRFPQRLSLRSFPIPTLVSTIGFIDFDLAIQHPDRLVLMHHNCLAQSMKDAASLLVIQLQSFKDRTIGQSQFKPVQQFVDGCPGQGGPSQPGIGAQGKLLVTTGTLPSIIAQRPQFPGEATLRTPGAIAKIGCTQDTGNLRASYIGCKNLLHMQLYT